MSDKKYLEAESLKEAMWKNFYAEEDKWESMPEAEFLDVHGGCPRHWFQLGFGVALDAVVKADPVPQEMRAREYAIARRRLCNAHLNAVNQCVDDFVTRCAGCLIEDYCEGAKDDVDEEIAIVEKWAREHPEERSEE